MKMGISFFVHVSNIYESHVSNIYDSNASRRQLGSSLAAASRQCWGVKPPQMHAQTMYMGGNIVLTGPCHMYVEWVLCSFPLLFTASICKPPTSSPASSQPRRQPSFIHGRCLKRPCILLIACDFRISTCYAFYSTLLCQV